MKFGKYETDAEPRRNSGASPMAVFSRGIQAGMGERWTFTFANGYGASVINDGYGHEMGQYELAVIAPDGKLAYDTPVTDDVLGWLTEEAVGEALTQIEALTPEVIAAHQVAKAAQERDERIAELRRELAALEAEAAKEQPEPVHEDADERTEVGAK